MIRNLQLQLDVFLFVEIPFSSSAEASAVMKALIPDNVNFPKGLSMKVFSLGKTLTIELTSKRVPITSVVNTLDEVLEHISLSKKVMTS